MKIHFVGSGDAFASGGRFNTCFLLADGRGRCLVDCGATSLVALKRQRIDPNGLDTVFITHLHGDHFGGLVFLLIDALYSSGRQTPLTIAGPPSLRVRLEAAMEALYPGSFSKTRSLDVHYVEMLPGDERVINGFEVLPLQVEHGSNAPALGLRIAAGGRTFAYSGDTAWCEVLPRLAEGADLLAVECSSFDKEIPGHINYRTLLEKRGELNARRIVLTHLGEDVLSRLPDLIFDTVEDGQIIDV